MGKRKQRKRIVYPPLDPMFISIGCTGLLRQEYDVPRLDLAPFLYYRIKVTSYSELISRILELLRTLPPMDDKAPPEPARPEDLDISLKRVHGPVYLFVAFDFEQRFLEGYLYFPSMTKDRQKWPSYHFLGLSHNWLYRLMYGPEYRMLRPWTNCSRRVRDPRHTAQLEQERIAKEQELRSLKEMVANTGQTTTQTTNSSPTTTEASEELAVSPEKRIKQLEEEIANMYDVVKSMGMQIGCRTESSYRCVQSKRSHKIMRIYRRGKKKEKYPAAYFRVYQLNLEDPRFAEYVEDNSMTSIRRDILPSEVEMFPGCRYMLVSQNRQYFMVLSNTWLAIFWNYGSEDLESLCRFNRNPSMSIAQRMIPFYGQSDTHLIIESGVLNIYSDIFDDEYNVFSRSVVAEGARSPFAMVLQNDGSLVIYDTKNTVVSVDDGFVTSSIYDPNNPFIDDYDPVADYRQRIINLIAYLRLYNLYREVLENKDTLPQDVAMYVLDDRIPPYNSETDYRERLRNLVNFLIAKGYSNLVEQAVDPSASVLSEVAATPDVDKVQTPPSAPASGLWKIPGALDPNQDADQPACEGLEDEELADCLDNQENALVAEEQQTDANAEAGEYELIDSEDPMAAAVSTEAPSSDSGEVRDFSREDYDRLFAACRVSSAKETYIQNQDLYCRVIALKEYLRQRGYQVMHEARTTSTNDGGVSFANGIQDYNQPIDFASRLQATRNLFPKTQ